MEFGLKSLSSIDSILDGMSDHLPYHPRHPTVEVLEGSVTASPRECS